MLVHEFRVNEDMSNFLPPPVFTFDSSGVSLSKLRHLFPPRQVFPQGYQGTSPAALGSFF
jgi:hypothetical protein